jgi:hypothetical protein
MGEVTTHLHNLIGLGVKIDNVALVLVSAIVRLPSIGAPHQLLDPLRLPIPRLGDPRPPGGLVVLLPGAVGVRPGPPKRPALLKPRILSLVFGAVCKGGGELF